MKRTAFIIALLFVCALAFADDIIMPRVTMPHAANNGFGGIHVAHTDNVFALSVNPAAMIRVQQKSFFSIAPSVMNPESTFGLIRTVLGGGFEETLEVLSEQNGKMALGFEIREFPLSIAWVADGFGFALMNNTLVNINIRGSYMEVNVYEDIMLPFGFAFKIFDAYGHTVDAGVTFTPFIRLMGKETIDILSVAGDLTDGGFDTILDRLDLPLMMGASFDLGFLYRWDKGFQAGLTLNDIFGRGSAVKNFLDDGNSGGSYLIPFSLNWGVAYDFRPERFWPFLPPIVKAMGVTFALDWHDFTNVFNQSDYTRRNFLLDLGAGLQFSLFDRLFLSIGMNEMLPAVGFGFDFGALKINVAYYGRELGNEPGHLSVAMVDFCMSIRPGAEKQSWPWTNKTILGSLGVGK